MMLRGPIITMTAVAAMATRAVTAIRIHLSMASPQAVVEIDRIVHGDGLSVPRRRLVLPAADGVHGRHVQAGDASEELEVRDVPRRVDRRLDPDASLNALGSGLARVFGVHAPAPDRSPDLPSHAKGPARRRSAGPARTRRTGKEFRRGRWRFGRIDLCEDASLRDLSALLAEDRRERNAQKIAHRGPRPASVL